VKGLTDIEKDFPGWYTDVVQKAKLADHAPVKGCMVIRPYGYALWQQMQRILDDRICETGHENAYFPMFIPDSLLQKEAAHIEGFNTEGVRVTKVGGKVLEEELVVRFSSEAIINTMFAKWVQSYRDLPILINQWANIVRWELRPRLFLRTSEFLWQEGHTAHATQIEAQEETLKMLEVYRDFMENFLAISPQPGRKSEREKFAGAEDTYTVEALMQDGKAVQMGTSHFFGQGFARAFDIKYQSREGKLEYAWTTSWGVSTRLVGAVIMAHGDARGLVLPPRIAPVQVVVVPIWKSDEEKKTVLDAVEDLRSKIRNEAPEIRLRVDDRDQYKPGYKFNEWELKGVPLRIELGPRDVASGEAVLANRLSGEKNTMPLESLPGKLRNMLDDFQAKLLERSRTFRSTHTHAVGSLDEIVEAVNTKGGFARAEWCEDAACEEKVQTACKATLRCILPEQDEAYTSCAVCGGPAKASVLFAKAY